ncbi:MAG: LutB/LldF family L-lactate oxidation iron-sulfur protein [Betaproteobacteria bacterium]
MRSQAMFFQSRAETKARDLGIRKKLDGAKSLFVGKRRLGMDALAADELNFPELRDASKAIRDKVVANLDVWLEIFEEQALATGAEVLWARDGAEVARLAVEIAQRHGVKKVVKSKSMLSEEADLNAAFEAAGIASIETDLGEYIVQLAKEPPSHIIAPAMHKSRDDVADLFVEHHGKPRQTDIPALSREAREVLRQHFLSADMGITGANFLVAETGSAALVTNEGNGRMVTTLPRLHVVITGIEKIIPSLNDLATLMRILPRSATGQSISNYVSLLTGHRREGETEGPEKTIFILVDNGRAGLVGTEFQPMLRCIRCGACMNHCPVFSTVGGHAYGWVYPGPMGSVLTPLYTGLKNARDLPHASTGCNQCGVVCPVGIPLPDLMHRLRRQGVEQGLRPWSERLGFKAWAWVARRPALYRGVTGLARRYLKWLANGEDRIQVLGLAPGWTEGRDLAVPAPKGFLALYQARKKTK